MISRAHGCIFIHQRKCAGVSIIRAFGLTLKDADWHLFNDGVLSPEWTAQGDLVARSFKVSIVRNPWDRLVSGWKYCRSTRERSLAEVLRDPPREGHDYRHLTRPQLDILAAPGAGLAVDFVMRFETLQRDFDALCDRIGKPRMPLPKLNATQRGDYRGYFDDETRELARAMFRKDVEAFGYGF